MLRGSIKEDSLPSFLFNSVFYSLTILIPPRDPGEAFSPHAFPLRENPFILSDIRPSCPILLPSPSFLSFPSFPS